jgi:peptide/nickel transport system permease protein
MGRYIIRRLLWAIVLLFAASFITFLVFYIFPASDPALVRAGKQPTPELVETIRHNLGLDKPWYHQYARYMGDLITKGSFGESYVGSREPVRNELFSRFPTTAYLAVGAAVVWLAMGIPIGMISAVKRGKMPDRAAMFFALIGISAPVYWFGLVMLYLFANDVGVLKIFPGVASCQEFHPITCAGSFILPWFVLALAFSATYARFTRSSLLETLGEDYIRTARAKGLSERRVILKHAMRGALTPIVSIFGLDVAGLLGGAVLTETVFNIPGLGRYAVSAIDTGNLPAIQGTVLFGALFIVMANLIVDIVYGILDPRVRFA